MPPNAVAPRRQRPTVVNIAIARELVGFLWAAMTDQPLTTRDQHEEAVA